MSERNFDEIQAQIQQHYQDGEYAKALELATRSLAGFPEQAPLLYYWRICMTARLDRPAQALRLLSEVLDMNVWYGEVLLRRSPSLEPLQGLPEFERLVEVNRQRQADDPAQSFPLLVLHPQGECQPGESPCPLLLALHGNTSTAQESLKFWRPAGRAGWLVAAPQSSQAMWKDAYVWNDMETARREIQHHAASIKRKYAVHPDQIVLGGHSMGGEVAIWLALTGEVEAAGFIVIGPGGPLTDEPDSWGPVIELAQGRSLRGYVIVGEQDDLIAREEILALVERLNEAGISTEVEIVPGARHDFVPEYEAPLLRGLEYLTEE